MLGSVYVRVRFGISADVDGRAAAQVLTTIRSKGAKSLDSHQLVTAVKKTGKSVTGYMGCITGGRVGRFTKAAILPKDRMRWMVKGVRDGQPGTGSVQEQTPTRSARSLLRGV
jgi:hypothetical protein